MKKNKNKKDKDKKKISKSTIICGLIGGIAGFLIASSSDLIQVIEGFIKLPSYINVVIFILTFILAVTLHEFGHAFSFIRNGIKMRAIIFTIFILIKEDGKWKFRIIGNKSLGGIAIPEIEGIKDEEDFILKQKGFANALIAGPKTSFIACVVLTAVGLLIIKLTTNIYIRSGLLLFIISLGVITFTILATSFMKNDMVVGDFPAYKMAKKDTYFTAIQLYNYGYFSSQPENSRNENIYLRELILKELTEKYKKQDTHWYTISMIDTIIVEYLAGFLEELPVVAKDYINFILETPELLSEIRTTGTKEILYFHLIILLHKNEETRQQSFKLYEELTDTIKPDTPKRKYLFRQIEHILGIADNKDYLMDKKNIVTSDMHFIYKNFHGFYMDEIKGLH